VPVLALASALMPSVTGCLEATTTAVEVSVKVWDFASPATPSTYTVTVHTTVLDPLVLLAYVAATWCGLPSVTAVLPVALTWTVAPETASLTVTET